MQSQSDLIKNRRIMKWITREKVKVDRVACPWLITRFIDNSPQFVFLPANTDWSAIADGIVYDVPNCELGHHGDDVSFQSILKKYQLEDPALQLLGQIVQAADPPERASSRRRGTSLDRSWLQRAGPER